MHSAGNEDARKALQAGALYGRSYDNLSFFSLGSPVSSSVMQQSVIGAGANYLGQVNDWRDPVTYGKLFLSSLVASGSVGAIGAGQSVLAGSAAGPWGWMAIGGGTAISGLLGAGKYGVQTYHPLQQYLAKPQARSIMFDWLKNNPPGK